MITKANASTAGKAYLRSVLNHLEEPVIATDENMVINYWNKEAGRIFNQDFNKAQGRDAFDVLQFIYCDTSAESVKNNLLYKGSWKGQLLQKTDLENTFSFDVSIRAINAEFKGYLWVFRNVTAQMQAEKELIGALQKEHQLHDMKNRFVCMASHEFRTPFSTILSSSNLIEKYKTTEEQANRVKHTNRIRESIHHLNAILEDFLSLTKLEEGKIVLHKYRFNLVNLVTEIIQDLEMIRKPGQQIIHSHIGASEITTDKKLLKMVLYNLVSNALKFSGEGKNIEITSSLVDGVTEVTVKDEGVGISAEDQEHIFKSFYRGKNAQFVGGTGLGLHISRRYIEMLEGKISLTSELGIGTTVKISI